jgi:hypothetical protein
VEEAELLDVLRRAQALQGESRRAG